MIISFCFAVSDMAFISLPTTVRLGDQGSVVDLFVVTRARDSAFVISASVFEYDVTCTRASTHTNTHAHTREHTSHTQAIQYHLCFVELFVSHRHSVSYYSNYVFTPISVGLCLKTNFGIRHEGKFRYMPKAAETVSNYHLSIHARKNVIKKV